MLLANNAGSNNARLRKCTKPMSCHGDPQGQLLTFDALSSGLSHFIHLISVDQKKNPLEDGLWLLSVELRTN